MADKFIQFNDDSMIYKINSSHGEIKKSSICDNAKLQKLFDIFNKNGDNVIDSEELGSLFEQVQKFAIADENSIFSSEEAEEFLSKQMTSDGKSLKDEGITVSDLFGFVKSVTVCDTGMTIQDNTKLPRKSAITTSFLPPSASDFEDNEVKDMSYQSIYKNLHIAKQLLSDQLDNEGVVSKGINSYKELSGSENARSRSQLALEREGLSLTILQEAKQGTLTHERYHELLNSIIKDTFTETKSYFLDDFFTGYYKQFKKDIDKILGIKDKNPSEEQVKNALLDKILQSLPIEKKQEILDKILSAPDEEFVEKKREILDEIFSSSITTHVSANTVVSGSTSKGRKLENQVDISINSKTTYSFSMSFNSNKKTNTPPPPPLDKLITYEEAFKLERNVPYNKENILDYESKAAHMQVVLKMYNASVAVHNIIAKATVDYNNAKVYDPTDPRQALHQDRLTFGATEELELHQGIRQALTYVFGTDIESGLKKIGIDAKFDPIIPNQQLDLEIAAALEKYMDDNFRNACGSKTLDTLEKELQESYTKAYGQTNVSTIVKNYIQSQQESVGYLKMGVQTAFMIVMIVGECCPVSAPFATAIGIIGTTFSSVGISALENYTKKNGPSEAEKREMLTELFQSGLLTITGMGIGRIAESVASRVAIALTKCPKFCAFVTEVGLDASMSLIADLAITGDIDLSSEGIAQLQQIIAGILHARGVKGYANKYKTKTDVGVPHASDSNIDQFRVNDPDVSKNNTSDASKMDDVSKANDTSKTVSDEPPKHDADAAKSQDGTQASTSRADDLAKKLDNANDRESFTAIRDEIKQLPPGKERDQLFQLYLQKYNEWTASPARPDVRMEFGGGGGYSASVNFVQQGNMQKGVSYVLNPEKFPQIQLAGSNIIDLNNPQIRKQIMQLNNGESLVIGRNNTDVHVDIPVPDANMSVSRQHLIVYKENGQFKIYDNSKGGSFVLNNPHPVQSVELKSGSMIKDVQYEISADALPVIKVVDYEVDLSQYKSYIGNLQEGQTFIVGRKQGNNIFINDTRVSDPHLVITKVNGKLHIRDMSTNGTEVVKLGSFTQRAKSKVNDWLANLGITSSLSKKEIETLQPFSNHPIIRAAANDTAKLKAIAKNIDKILDNSSIVSPEISTAIRSGYAYLNIGANERNAVRCIPSENIMNDIIKLASGEDYIKHFNYGISMNEVMARTPVGEVASIGGRLYVNNGSTLEQINLSEQTFRMLFPPVERFSTHQGSVGTCYLVSSIEGLYSTPKGRVELYRLIGEDQNGIYTTTANSKGQRNYFRRFDRYNKHIREERGLAIIEQGYCKNERLNALDWNSSETQIMHVNAGGWAQDAIEGLIGRKPYVEKNPANMRQYIMSYANSDQIVINAGTKAARGQSDVDALNPQYNIYAGHEYCIKGYDASSDCVIIANPWSSGLNIRVPMNEFLNCFNEISVIRL